MIQKDFNEEAMEKKIKLNIDKGFKIEDIKVMLLEEFLENRKSTTILEQRAVELQDQIEYLDNEYRDQLIKFGGKHA